jgi:ribonuclease P/MRP protein subunit RPP40
LLLVSQSGFRKHHSCQTTLTKLIDSWLKDIDNGEMTGLLLVDFRKAFDLVDHDILLKKLSTYRFNDIAMKWFQSYLNERTQQVSVGAHMSDKQNIISGVPQGSILGPLLFIIFMNDLGLYTEFCNIDLYADDTNLHISDKDLNNIESKLNSDMQNIELWSKSNKMVIHPNKCKSLLITNKRKKVQTSDENQ